MFQLSIFASSVRQTHGRLETYIFCIFQRWKRNNKTNTSRWEMLRENDSLSKKGWIVVVQWITFYICSVCVCASREKFECIVASFFEKQELAWNGKKCFNCFNEQICVAMRYVRPIFSVLISILNLVHILGFFLTWSMEN